MNTDEIKNQAQDIKKQAQEKLSKASDKAKDVLHDANKEAAKSCKDWVNYIQDHPVQSVFFGLVGYFALKGILK